MQYSEAKQGRIFVLRLEDGETVHAEIEKFAYQKSIKAAALIIVGGADKDSKLVVGPEKGRAQSISPMTHVLSGVHEIAGTGTLFPDEDGQPSLHMHMACGRMENAVVGCIRTGVTVWHIMEVIMIELTDTNAKRMLDPETGFKLLNP